MYIEKKIKFKKGEITKKIFFILAGITGFGVIMTAALIAPNYVQLIRFFEIDKKRKKNIQRAIYRLKKQKLVEIYEENGKEVVKITEKGKQKVLKCNFKELKIKKPRRWDRLWRIVIFDIPSKEKRARDALRMKLKQLGFFQLQKSVFVYPFDCKDEIEFITEFFNVKKFVNYIEAKSIEGENKLKRYFKLSFLDKIKDAIKKS